MMKTVLDLNNVCDMLNAQLFKLYSKKGGKYHTWASHKNINTHKLEDICIFNTAVITRYRNKNRKKNICMC